MRKMKSTSPNVLLFAVLTTLVLPSGGFAETSGSETGASPAWSPYLVGGLLGVLSMVTFYFSNKPLGASTAYETIDM